MHRIAAAGLLLGCLLWAPDAAPAQEGWHVERFDSRVRVERSGTVHVRETIRVRFDGSYNGIYREIPVEYRTPGGFDYDLDLDVVSVEGPDGGALRHELSRDGRYRKIQIWVPGASDATRTVVLLYRVRGALQFDETHDELYWNVTGSEWPVPIREARVRMELPEGAAGVRTVAYQGPYGSEQEASASVAEGGRVVTAAADGLAPHEGLTVSALWDAGVVTRPTPWDRARRFLGDNWPVLGGLLVGLLTWLWWRARGRDPEVETVTVRYEPPEGLRPAQMGTLLDHRLDPRDLSATIVDLAVRGYLRIEESRNLLDPDEEEEPDGYSFELRKGREEWSGLEPHERAVLEGMFDVPEAGAVTDTESLENSFYRELGTIRDHLYGGALSGLIRGRSDRVRKVWLGLAGSVAVLGFFALMSSGFELLGASPVSLGSGLLISGAFLGGFGYFMPVRTRRGTRELAKVLGFEEFLTRVEEDRYREMISGPEDFERYLPYAIAFGVAREWARAFEGLVTEPPDWYAGRRGGDFHTVVFARDMGSFSDDVGTAMTSSPRGQGEGGGNVGSAFSGGGGFSGGGFGGGGGGAF